VEERTALLRDLTRLVQELEEAAKPGHEQGEDQKERKEPRLLEGQIRAREPDMVLASELQGAVVSLPAEKRIGEVDDLIIKADGLGPPVVAPSLGQSALFLARTVRLIFGPGWMVPTAASCMVLLTTIATLSHFSRVCARITGACGPWTHAADGRALINSKGVTPSASTVGFDER
jgi:hypothetical protein